VLLRKRYRGRIPSRFSDLLKAPVQAGVVRRAWYGRCDKGDSIDEMLSEGGWPRAKGKSELTRGMNPH